MHTYAVILRAWNIERTNIKWKDRDGNFCIPNSIKLLTIDNACSRKAEAQRFKHLVYSKQTQPSKEDSDRLLGNNDKLTPQDHMAPQFSRRPSVLHSSWALVLSFLLYGSRTILVLSAFPPLHNNNTLFQLHTFAALLSINANATTIS